MMMKIILNAKRNISACVIGEVAHSVEVAPVGCIKDIIGIQVKVKFIYAHRHRKAKV